MKEVILNINELSDSREMIESKPHPFLQMFIYIILSLVFCCLIWSYISEIDIVVKAQGVVRPMMSISSINNIVGGTVNEVNMKDGMEVEKGDLLYSLNVDQLKSKYDFYVKEKSNNENKLDNLEKMKISLINRCNLFDEIDQNESHYYRTYENYQYELIRTLDSIKILRLRVVENNADVESLNEFIKSIETDTDEFKHKKGSYYLSYRNYTLGHRSKSNLIDEINESLSKSKKLYESGVISLFELQSKEFELEKAKLDLESYEIQIRNELEAKLAEKIIENNQLEIEINQLAPSTLGDFEDRLEIAQNNFISQKIIEIESNIQNIERQLEQINMNIKTIDVDLKSCIVRAPIDGYINLFMDISQGDNLVSPLQVATVIPNDKKNVKVQLYIQNEDIGDIEVGDEVLYNFMALPYKEFGELNGVITSIAEDIKPSKDNANLYFVEADIENTELIGYKSDERQIKVGMLCEARVVTKRKKIAHYILEKIDLRL